MKTGKIQWKIPKESEEGNFISEFQLSENKTSLNMSETKVSIIKTSIIALSIAVSVCVFSYSYYESNRYAVEYGHVIDKYNKTATKLNLQH
jgi:hypothetical protein